MYRMYIITGICRTRSKNYKTFFLKKYHSVEMVFYWKEGLFMIRFLKILRNLYFLSGRYFRFLYIILEFYSQNVYNLDTRRTQIGVTISS